METQLKRFLKITETVERPVQIRLTLNNEILDKMIDNEIFRYLRNHQLRPSRIKNTIHKRIENTVHKTSNNKSQF